MIVVLLLFTLPCEPTFLHACAKDKERRPKAPSKGLLTWKACHMKVPWGMLFLLGGGFALADGARVSGMTAMLAKALRPLIKLPRFVVLVIACMFASFVSDFASNVAVANVMLPVLADMSVVARWHPLYLMLPTAIACGQAFSLPVGTPPNALVQVVGNIPTLEFLKTGVIASLIAIVPLLLLGPVLSVFIFDIDKFPDWALPKNVTITTTTMATTTSTTKKQFIVFS